MKDLKTLVYDFFRPNPENLSSTCTPSCRTACEVEFSRNLEGVRKARQEAKKALMEFAGLAPSEALSGSTHRAG